MNEEKNGTINIVALLMEIKEDVSSIKTDMSNVKESQRIEKNAHERDLRNLETRLTQRIDSLQAKQISTESDVQDLKILQDKADAKKYRTIIAFILTAFGGMLVSNISNFLSSLIK